MNTDLDSILSYYDISLEALEYARESAALEVYMGRIEFIPVYEAANNAANNQNAGWFAKLKQSVMTFIRSAMSNIKSAMNKVGNANRAKTAQKMKDRVQNKATDGGRKTVTLTPDQMTIMSNAEMEANLRNFKNITMQTLRAVKQTGKTDSEWLEKYKENFTKYFTGKSTGSSYQADATDIARYLSKSNKMLTDLESTFNRVNDIVSGMKSTNASTSQIRLATSFSYNFLTKMVRNHYNISMQLARDFMTA